MSNRPRSLIGFVSFAVLAALIGTTGLPGQQLGLNALLVWIAIVIAVWVACREALDPSDATFLALALVPVSLVILRSAGWVVALQLLVAVGSVAVGTARVSGWLSVMRAPLRVVANLHRGLALVLTPLGGSVSGRMAHNLAPAARAGALSAILLALFGGLFISADAAFASLAEKWLVPELDISLVPARVAVFIGTLALAGALARLSPLFQSPAGSVWGWPNQTGNQFRLSPQEWKVALLSLDLLFGMFVAVQLAVLFGGHTHVLTTTGLTYAEYARQGFFQLVVVAILSLGVIAATIRFGDEREERGWMRALLGLLCLLTLVILVSAFKRMNLYQEAYGFTRMRLLVDLSIIWLAVVFCLIIAAGMAWKGSWLPRATVAVSIVAVSGFAIFNPDARIAERNIQRFKNTGDIDLAYLGGLSADALPALLSLPEPQRTCAISPILARARPPTFWSWNVAREESFEISRRSEVSENRC